MNTKLIALSLLSAGMLSPAAISLAAPTGSEYVYVETNLKTANGNSIAAFARGANGTLTEIPGSPFLTGGAGTQYAGVNVGPQDSDQNIITNSDHTLLFAVNSGSDSIAVFHIQSNGSLTPVEGSPFPSGGNDPVSLGISGNTLFVVNKSGDFGRPSNLLPNYTTFQIASNGALTPSIGYPNESTHPSTPTVEVAIGSSPSQAHVVPGTNLLFGNDFLGGLIQRFQFDGNGGLIQLSPLSLYSSAYNKTGAARLPLGMWNHPTLPILYIGYVSDGMIGVYKYRTDGTLNFLHTVATTGQAVCWLRTNAAGTRLYSSNTVSNSIVVHDITDPENPVEIQELPLAGLGNVLQFELSADGKNLYALSSRGATTIPEGQGNVLHTLSIASDGTVDETAAPIAFAEPNDTRPQGVLTVVVP